MSKILLIEDDFQLLENIAEILQASEYDVSIAEDGKTGVALAQKLTPDLIICDINMPGLNGFDVLNILSKNPETADIPFIFLTSIDNMDYFNKGMDMGADGYLTKPFARKELIEFVELCFRKEKNKRTAR